MIDQSIGNDHPPMSSGSNSPNPSLLASHDPTNHPIKPITIEPRIPPVQLPDVACPMAPQIPVSNNKMRSDSSDIFHPSFINVESKTPVHAGVKIVESVTLLSYRQIMVPSPWKSREKSRMTNINVAPAGGRLIKPPSICHITINADVSPITKIVHNINSSP
jgi:hypothetical protein